MRPNRLEVPGLPDGPCRSAAAAPERIQRRPWTPRDEQSGRIVAPRDELGEKVEGEHGCVGAGPVGLPGGKKHTRDDHALSCRGCQWELRPRAVYGEEGTVTTPACIRASRSGAISAANLASTAWPRHPSVARSSAGKALSVARSSCTFAASCITNSDLLAHLAPREPPAPLPDDQQDHEPEGWGRHDSGGGDREVYL
jgi:hypothetical protein